MDRTGKPIELGSEFYLDLSQLEDTGDTVFSYLKDHAAIYTDSGRSAIRLLSPLLHGQKILVPEYLCASVTEALPKDCHIIFYPINRHLEIEIEKLEELIQKHQIQWLYLMHYFGVLQPKEILDRIALWKEKYHLIVIEDTTHSLFTEKQTVGDYCVGSLRKWFPIPDGGVLYCKKDQRLPQPPAEKKPASQKVEAMVLKKLFLTEGFECNAKYREIFAREEASFDQQTEIFGISDVSRFLLSHFSVGKLCSQRRKNAAQLMDGLKNLALNGVFNGGSLSGVLLAFPVYARQRDGLRGFLMDQRIYCAVHWPIGEDIIYQDTIWIGRHILSLPIDQRYGEEEIAYLLDCVKCAGEEMGSL